MRKRGLFGDAHEQDGTREAQRGAVTFLQCSGGRLNLHLHCHLLAFHALFAAEDDGHPRFRLLPSPTMPKWLR